MRVLFPLAAALLVAPAGFAQYSMGTAGAPPAAASAVDPAGIRISTADGKPWCELWFAKTLPAGAKSTEESVSLPAVPHGAFLGIARFPAQAQDRRGNPIKAGVYAMRYSLFPNDGNHMGAAPQRDFAILIPADKDKPPAEMLNYEALMALSREAAAIPHPSVLSLAPSTEEKLPALKKEAEHDWTLHIKIGGTPVALIVAGKAEN
jgi:hypothetical protein